MIPWCSSFSTPALTRTRREFGWTPLDWASRGGHDTVVQQLLDAGADANAKGEDGWTPLYWASRGGHDTVVQQLLNAGADANVKDEYGWTPLYWASEMVMILWCSSFSTPVSIQM